MLRGKILIPCRVLLVIQFINLSIFASTVRQMSGNLGRNCPFGHHNDPYYCLHLWASAKYLDVAKCNMIVNIGSFRHVEH